MENIVLIFSCVSIVALCLAGYAMHLSIDAKISVEALRKSTHSVQLVPSDSMAWSQEEKELNRAFNKSMELDDVEDEEELKGVNKRKKRPVGDSSESF